MTTDAADQSGHGGSSHSFVSAATLTVIRSCASLRRPMTFVVLRPYCTPHTANAFAEPIDRSRAAPNPAG
jgi:hypothetical protein